MKKLILLSLIITFGIFANAQIVNIPDTLFKYYLINHIPVIDSNGDDEIQVGEASAFGGTLLLWTDAPYYPAIYDLTGIEAFTQITGLFCFANQLSSLDLSNNSSLTDLSCSANQLSSIDLGNNNNIIHLDCSSNQLSSLDLSNNSSLTHLSCNTNQLSSLDLSNNSSLTDLDCSYNQLSSLDLSNNSSLTHLSCSYNQLSSLDVKNGNNINLTSFHATNNPYLYCIDVDDSTWSASNWTYIDTQSYFSENCTVGIQELNAIEPRISPNPFSEQIEIEFEIRSLYEIRILDLLGKEVLKTKVTDNKQTLNTSALPSGTYIMQILSDDKLEAKKIVKY